jgi:hypothetical protein
MGRYTKANGPADLYLFKLHYPKIECFGERRKKSTARRRFLLLRYETCLQAFHNYQTMILTAGKR